MERKQKRNKKRENDKLRHRQRETQIKRER